MKNTEIDILKSAVEMSQQAKEAASEAANLLRQITVHSDWKCEEQSRIKESVSAVCQKAEQIKGYTNSFYQAVRQVLEKEERIRGASAGIERVQEPDKKVTEIEPEEMSDKNIREKKEHTSQLVILSVCACICVGISWTNGQLSFAWPWLLFWLMPVLMLASVFVLKSRLVAIFSGLATAVIFAVQIINLSMTGVLPQTVSSLLGSFWWVISIFMGAVIMEAVGTATRKY